MKEIVSSLRAEQILVEEAVKKSGIIGVEYYDSCARRAKAVAVFGSNAWQFAKISDFGCAIDSKLGASVYQDKALTGALPQVLKMYKFDNVAEFAEWITAA